MERKRKPIRKGKVSAILTSDWHLREDHPVCRTDDFWNEQWKKLDCISDLQKEHECDVIHAGDLFDFWKPSPMLLSKAIEHLPNRFKTVYGNHDLPQHSIEQAFKSGVYTLHRAGKLEVLDGLHWGQKNEEPLPVWVDKDTGRMMVVWHVMTWQGKRPWHDCKDPDSSQVLKENRKADIYLTGHNHKTFVEEKDGRVLLNPGSIFRMTADQDEHRPCVWLWYAATNTVKPVYLPISKDVISREHIDVKKERDNRIDAFIDTLDTEWEADMDFEKNIDIFMQTNDVEEDVKSLVYKSINK